MSERLRVLYFGMPCTFSYAPLAVLLASPLAVAAVVVPGLWGRRPVAAGGPIARPGAMAGPRAGALDMPAGLRVLPPPDLPLFPPGQERALVYLAWAQRIPVLQVANPSDAATVAALAAYRPDVIAVACFPWRLPPAVLALPRLGALNVHPSLLPAGRGPAPLFWTFHLGERRTGVTVHLMTDELDAGDILLQEALEVPEGIAGLDLEERCAEVGGRLLVEAIRALAGGTAVRRPQDPAAASYHPWPSPADLVVDPDRPAGWAFGFIRGVASLGYQPVARCAGERLVVADAVGYEPDGVLGQPCLRRGRELRLQCTPGVLHASLAEEAPSAGDD